MLREAIPLQRPHRLGQLLVLRSLLQDLVELLDRFLQPLGVDRGAPSHLLQVPIAVFFILGFIHPVDLVQQASDLLLQLPLVARGVLGLHRPLAVGVGFDLGPVQKIVLQLEEAFVDQQPHHPAEDVLHHPPQHRAAKTIDRPEVWSVQPAQPHEVHVLPQRLGDLPTRVDPLGVGVHQHLEHHLRMVAALTATLVLPYQRPQVHSVYGIVDHPHHMLRRDQLLQIGRQLKLAPQVRLEHHMLAASLFDAPIVVIRFTIANRGRPFGTAPT